MSDGRAETSHSTPNRGQHEHGRVSSIILYSHDGFGLGHLKRSVRIAEELHRRAPESSVLIVTSSPAAGRPFIPEEFEFLKLPSVTKTGTERYRPNLKT